jgi:outer membrane protein TolC
MRPIALLALTLLTVAGSAQAQAPLSLRAALERAAEGSYANRIAAGEARSRSAEALAPLKGILPTARLESGYLRTTDPLGAFGFVLRQRTVTQAAFSPATLNDPDPAGNLVTGLVIEQPLFNADAWLGRTAATDAREAARSAEQWTQATTAIEVVRGYWGAVLAAERVRTLEAALDAARSHQREAESMVTQGLVTRSDALLASVKAGEVEAALIGARSQSRLSRRGLAVLLGTPADTAFTLPDSLPPAELVRMVTERARPDQPDRGGRADVRAAEQALSAAEANRRRAGALYLPRLNSFGRIEWNTPGTPFGGKSAWTVGLMLSWSPFSGASELSEGRAASGRRMAASARADAARAQATLEQARAADELAVARARLDLAERAVAQAREAHRIVGRKYEGGLASVTDLFDAAVVETSASLGYAAARHDALVALAEQLKAAGSDLSPLLDLDN